MQSTSLMQSKTIKPVKQYGMEARVMSIKRYNEGDYLPLNDYANHNRKTDAKPEKQDGAGAIAWIAVAAVCWIIILALAASAGYFN